MCFELPSEFFRGLTTCSEALDEVFIVSVLHEWHKTAMRRQHSRSKLDSTTEAAAAVLSYFQEANTDLLQMQTFSPWKEEVVNSQRYRAVVCVSFVCGVFVLFIISVFRENGVKIQILHNVYNHRNVNIGGERNLDIQIPPCVHIKSATQFKRTHKQMEPSARLLPPSVGPRFEERGLYGVVKKCHSYVVM